MASTAAAPPSRAHAKSNHAEWTSVLGASIRLAGDASGLGATDGGRQRGTGRNIVGRWRLRFPFAAPRLGFGSRHQLVDRARRKFRDHPRNEHAPLALGQLADFALDLFDAHRSARYAPPSGGQLPELFSWPPHTSAVSFARQ